jgi:UMF1 family MFS transporter
MGSKTLYSLGTRSRLSQGSGGVSLPQTFDETDPHQAAAAPVDRLGVLSWCFYDWANSSFSTVVTTFIFATYFTEAVAESSTAGTAQWGRTLGLCGLVIAILSPIFGAIGDRGGRRKPWIAVFTLLCVGGTSLLWFIAPSPGYAAWALLLFAAATLGFEFATVFYNAMLPDITSENYLGRVSGWGWGLGYVGGLVCLIVALLVFVQAEQPPFGLDRQTSEHIRATGPLVGLWYAVFSLPLFLWTADRPSTGLTLRAAVGDGLRTLVKTLWHVRQYGSIVRFLIAHMIYADGLVTLFAFAGIYAAGTFGMDFTEVIWLGIALNVTAGLGSAIFAWVDDKAGSKTTIAISLACLFGLGIIAVVAESKQTFWLAGMAVGVFVGPAQAASRSMMARLAPRQLQAEMFGLYALSGKATTFLGPVVLGTVTEMFDSQRAGMASVLCFFLVGLVLLLPVQEPRPDGGTGLQPAAPGS